LGVKIVPSVLSDTWSSDVVGFNPACRLRVDGASLVLFFTHI